MSKNHSVTQGECLVSLACLYGFMDPQTIYLHPQNADLRDQRPNPHLLLPGDIVYVPDKREKRVSCPTGQTHRFMISRRKVLLRIYMHDSDDRPLGDRKYLLIVEGSTIAGRTTAEGLVEQEIQATARNGQLTIWPENDEEADDSHHMFDLLIGSLDPEHEVTGVQARLNNLGFSCGGVDGILGPKTRAALVEFQRKHGLEATGAITAAVSTKLREIHDSE